MNTFLTSPCDHGPLDQAPPDRRYWARLRRFLQDGHQRDRAIHWPDSYRFASPAQGDGYDFTVDVNFTWCVTGPRRVEDLVRRAEDRHAALRDRLLAQLRPVSRRYAPYEAAEAEKGIAEEVDHLLTRASYEYRSPDGPDGRARPIDPRTTVKLDDAVREAQQQAWNLRQDADNAQAYARLLVPQMTELRDLWRGFLKSGEAQWVTPYAVALANEPARATNIVEQMFKDRHGQARELAKEVVEQSEKYGDQSAFELMTSNDTVLRRLMTLMGVEEPAELAPGPYDDIDGGRAAGANGDGRA